MVMRTDQEGRRREGWRGHTVGVTRFGGLEVGYSKVLVYRRHPLDRISPPPEEDCHPQTKGANQRWRPSKVR